MIYRITSDNPVGQVSIIATIISYLHMSFILYKIQKIKQNRIFYRLLALSLINIVQFSTFAFYGYIITNDKIFRFAAILSSILATGIGLLNVEILLLFRVLQEKISGMLIQSLRWIIVIVSILLLFPTIILLVLDENSIPEIIKIVLFH